MYKLLEILFQQMGLAVFSLAIYMMGVYTGKVEKSLPFDSKTSVAIFIFVWLILVTWLRYNYNIQF